MTGLSNYSADNLLNYVSGGVAFPALPSVFMALFTAVGTDAGTGFTEVSGGSYARMQVAGNAATNGTTASGNATLHFATTPAWVQPGMLVSDTTSGSVIPSGTTVLSVTGTTVVMSANATGGGVGSGDTINFTAFAPAASGTAPSTIANGSIVTFAQATASWGTVIAFGLYDASTSGNLLAWDFIGNFSWLPFEVPTGSNPSFSVKGNGFLSNDPLVFTQEYGGSLPSASTGTFTGYNILFAASPTTDATNVDTVSGPSTPVVLTSSGSGMVRKITQQPVAINVTVTFPANSLTITAA